MAKVKLFYYYYYNNFCWKCWHGVFIKPLDNPNSVSICFCFLFRQVFMKSSAKKPLVWRRRIWSLVCSPTKSQKLKQYDETVLELLLIFTEQYQTILMAYFLSPRCATWCPHQAPAVPSFPVHRIRCISTSSWRNWETRWKAWYLVARW